MADSLQCYERQAPVPTFPKAACIIPCGTPRRKAQAPYAPSGARRIKNNRITIGDPVIGTP